MSKQTSIGSFFTTKGGGSIRPPKRKDGVDISKFMVKKQKKAKSDPISTKRATDHSRAESSQIDCPVRQYTNEKKYLETNLPATPKTTPATSDDESPREAELKQMKDARMNLGNSDHMSKRSKRRLINENKIQELDDNANVDLDGTRDMALKSNIQKPMDSEDDEGEIHMPAIKQLRRMKTDTSKRKKIIEDSDGDENDIGRTFYKSGSKTTKQSSESDAVHELKASHQDVAEEIERQNDNSEALNIKKNQIKANVVVIEENASKNSSKADENENSQDDVDMAGDKEVPDATGDESDDEDKSALVEKKSSKKSINNVLKAQTNVDSSKSAKSGTKKSESIAKQMKSNDTLLDKDAYPYLWKQGEPVPYTALCEVFSSIEAISARLEIQQLMTELFRQTILLLPNSKPTSKIQNDLLNLIYLASNSVAPSYECVELGVGDAILIKAIGESYGTNPLMIKQRYEKEGDLGSVAASAKGMQRTLNFGMKPKPLMLREILTVFRQIATTSGSQSQKWKVDKIKGLLVRAKGHEAKYVIRGLQGKLRIGLAQSTVLVGLAHSLVLSPPPSVQITSYEDLARIAGGETDGM